MPTAFAIAAHPDDIEFCMSGTLMLLKKAGYEIHYMNIANGCHGSNETTPIETAMIRAAEGQAGAESIGAIFHPSLVDDIGIFYDDATLRRVAAVVREVKPKIVLTHSPVDYMEDHTNACRLAVTAAFTHAAKGYITNPPRPYFLDPVTVYHAQPHGHCDPLYQPIVPSILVDTSSVMKEKIAMLLQHQSQEKWLQATQANGLADLLEVSLKKLRSLTGNKYQYLEGWRKHLHFGFCEETDDPLVEALAPYVSVS